MNTQTRPALASLQLLRGIAALAVVAYHVHVIGSQQGFAFGTVGGQVLAEAGRFGVNLFFVLSGFVICHAHAGDVGRPARLGRYLWRRVTRIYPVYWLFSLGFVAAAMAGLGSPDYRTDWPSVLSSITLLRFTESPLPPLLVAWTLFYEMQFYLVFALLIANRRVGLIAFALWAGWVALANLAGMADPLRLWTLWNVHFFLGCLAWLAARHLTARHALPLAFGGVVAVALGIAGTTFAVEPIDGVNRAPLLLAALGFAAVILAGVLADTAIARRAPALLRLLGDASYSLYLVHSAIVSACCIVAGKLGLVTLLPTPLAYAGIAAVAVTGGCIAHLVIERPIQRWLRGKAGEHRPAASAPINAMKSLR